MPMMPRRQVPEGWNPVGLDDPTRSDFIRSQRPGLWGPGGGHRWGGTRRAAPSGYGVRGNVGRRQAWHGQWPEGVPRPRPIPMGQADPGVSVGGGGGQGGFAGASYEVAPMGPMLAAAGSSGLEAEALGLAEFNPYAAAYPEMQTVFGQYSDV